MYTNKNGAQHTFPLEGRSVRLQLRKYLLAVLRLLIDELVHQIRHLIQPGGLHLGELMEQSGLLREQAILLLKKPVCAFMTSSSLFGGLLGFRGLLNYPFLAIAAIAFVAIWAHFFSTSLVPSPFRPEFFSKRKTSFDKDTASTVG